jgi:hypothetical protein
MDLNPYVFSGSLPRNGWRPATIRYRTFQKAETKTAPRWRSFQYRHVNGTRAAKGADTDHETDQSLVWALM